MSTEEFDKLIGQRLTIFMEYCKSAVNSDPDNKKLGKIAFAASIGLDGSQFTRIRKGEASLSLAYTLDLASKYSLNINWLVTGLGEMTVQQKSGTTTAPDQLLTQIGNHAEAIVANLKAIRQGHRDVFQPGTALDPRFSQTSKTSGKRNSSKKPKDNPSDSGSSRT